MFHSSCINKVNDDKCPYCRTVIRKLPDIKIDESFDNFIPEVEFVELNPENSLFNVDIDDFRQWYASEEDNNNIQL